MQLKEYFSAEKIDCTTSPKNFGYHQKWEEGKRTTHFLMIAGTAYDKGYWYGRYLAQAIHHLNYYILKFSAKVGLGITQKKYTKEDYFKQGPRIFRKAPPELLSEFQGIVDGSKEAGFPFKDEREVTIVMTFFELNEAACCSACAIQPPLSLCDTLQINSTEFPFPVKEQDNPTIVTYFPQDLAGNRIKNAHVSLSFAGLLGGLSGINEKGLSYGFIRSSNINDPSYIEGTPIVTLLNSAMQNASVIKEAYEVIQSQKRTNSYFVIISDPKQSKNSLNLWFLGPTVFKAYESGEAIDHSLLTDPRYSQYTPLNNAVYWMDMPVPGIEAGPEKPYEAIKAIKEPIGNQQAMDICTFLGSRYSVVSSIFNSTQMQGWVAFANNKNPSHLDTFHYLDLDKIFSSYSHLYNFYYHQEILKDFFAINTKKESSLPQNSFLLEDIL